ncbi:ATP-dependent 26S proteasome regulatory subunit [Enterocytozoon bieneusi H348]|nr:ATP-dependent 26S proteasome regulatory subunit [Enterocytozoon bieneusi H348]|eukprot:XP_001828082.1 ATP-dependent 26S proteasome regulatory subunit [Enterocytozoon bieneusi H348]
MIRKNNEYMPSLFGRTEHVKTYTDNKQSIPQNTYYDTPMSVEHIPVSRHIVIFGFTPSNRIEVINKVKSIVSIQRIEDGKNYISVWCEELEDLEKLIKLNYQKINGEIVGAFRKNFGIIENEEIFEKKRGLFEKFWIYLFGSK